MNAHIGQPDQRLLQLMVRCLHVYERTKFSQAMQEEVPLNIHKLEDPQGRRMVWFSSGPVLEEGRWHHGSATVRDHGEYQGMLETKIYRCRFDTCPEGYDPHRPASGGWVLRPVESTVELDVEVLRTITSRVWATVQGTQRLVTWGTKYASHMVRGDRLPIKGKVKAHRVTYQPDIDPEGPVHLTLLSRVKMPKTLNIHT